MSLSSLPADTLRVVFRNLDPVDVARIGMTCKDLHRAAQDRDFWVDQIERLRQEHPVVRLATPPLTSLSTQELVTFIFRWNKLCLCWDKGDNNLGFTAKGTARIPGQCKPKLLPGGKSLLFTNNAGGITLHQITLEDGQLSLPVVSEIAPGQGPVSWLHLGGLLAMMSPCPMLVHDGNKGSGIHIIKVDHHNNEMSVETVFHIPKGYHFLRADGRGRVISFLMDTNSGTEQRVIVTHLDHLEVIVEISTDLRRNPDRFKVCMPTKNLVVLYNNEHIIACKIPEFSGLSVGVNHVIATSVLSFPGLDRSFTPWLLNETIFDLSPAKEFDIYYVDDRNPPQLEVVTVIVPVAASDDDGLASGGPAESPVPRQTSNTLPCHQNFGFSCSRGLHFDEAPTSDGVHYTVTSLKGLALQGQRKLLQMFVSREELKQDRTTTKIDMDEATGRVIIWGWNIGACEEYETTVFIGDLV